MFILDAISNYTPKDDKEAQSICERVTPRLAHANAAVVLSAVKVGINTFQKSEISIFDMLLIYMYRQYFNNLKLVCCITTCK